MSAGRSERERKRVDARRNEDKTRVKQRGQRRPGMGMILHLSFLSSGFPFYSVLSLSLRPSIRLCLCVYGCLYRCLSIYERYDHQV